MASESESLLDPARKLASIQIVSELEPHPNADALDILTVLGWKVVIARGQVQPDDKVLFCEIDSLIPIDQAWLPPQIQERIRKDKVKKGFRLRTIRLRGHISQGLVVPLTETLEPFATWEVGSDLTSTLKIRKYEPPTFFGRWRKHHHGLKPFPRHLLSPTEELRIQSYPHLLRDLEGQAYYKSVKLDGTSGTFLLDPQTQELLCCSRNYSRQRPAKVSECPYWSLAEKFDLEGKLRRMPQYALQGEICGPDIQKNLLGLSQIHFYVFNVIDLHSKTRVSRKMMLEVCRDLGLDPVPIAEVSSSFEPCSIPELVHEAQGVYAGTSNHREGLVVRSEDTQISFKVINVEYLLRHD